MRRGLLGSIGFIRRSLKSTIFMGGLTAGIGAFLVKSVKLAGSFESQMSQLKAVTQATNEQMKQLSDLALDISTHSIFSAKEIGHAFTELAKAGISTENILKGAGEAAVVLAHATAGDLSRSSSIIAITMNQFGLSGEQAMHVADVLTLGANTSAASVESLGQSLSYTGGAAKNMGISFEDTVAMLDAMADAGLKGSRTGTNLQAALQAIASPSDAGLAIWQSWGTVLEDVNGNFIGMDKLLPEIYNHVKDMGDLERTATLKDLFGTLGGRAMNALLLTQTPEAIAAGKGWSNYKENLVGAGAAMAQSKILLDNMQGSIKKLKNSLNVFMIQIGLFLTPIVRHFADALTKLVQAFVKLPKPAKAVFTIMLVGLALIGPLVLLFTALGAAIGLLLTPWGLLLELLLFSFIGMNRIGMPLSKIWKLFEQLATAMALAYGKGTRIQDLLAHFPPSIQGLIRPFLDLADAIGDIVFAFKTEGFDAGLQAFLNGLPRLAGNLFEVGFVTASVGVKVIVTGIGAFADWVTDKGADLYGYLKDWLGVGKDPSAPHMEGGKIVSGQTTSWGNVLADFGLIPRVMLEKSIVTTGQQVVDWIARTLFLGYRGKFSKPVMVDIPTMGVGVVDTGQVETYRKRVQGIFQDWANKHDLIIRTKVTTYIDGIGDTHIVRTFNWNAFGELLKKDLHDIPVRGVHWTFYIGFPEIASEDVGYATGRVSRKIAEFLKDHQVLVTGIAWTLMIGFPVVAAGGGFGIIGAAAAAGAGALFGWPGIALFIAGAIALYLLNEDIQVAVDKWIATVGVPSSVKAAEGIGEAYGIPPMITDAIIKETATGIEIGAWKAIVDSPIEVITAADFTWSMISSYIESEILNNLVQAGTAAGIVEGIGVDVSWYVLIGLPTDVLADVGFTWDLAKWMINDAIGVGIGGSIDAAHGIKLALDLAWSVKLGLPDVIWDIPGGIDLAEWIIGIIWDKITPGGGGDIAPYAGITTDPSLGLRTGPQNVQTGDRGGMAGIAAGSTLGTSNWRPDVALIAQQAADAAAKVVASTAILTWTNAKMPIPVYGQPQAASGPTTAVGHSVNPNIGGGGGKLVASFISPAAIATFMKNTGDISSHGDDMKKKLEAAFNRIKTTSSTSFMEINRVVPKEYTAMKTNVVGTSDILQRDTTNKFVQMKTGMITQTQAASGNVISTVANMRGVISGMDFGSAGFGIGYSFGLGLVNGIQYWGQIAQNVAAALVLQAVQAARNAIGAHSPADATIELGHDMVDGLLIPMNDRSGEVSDSFSKMMNFSNASKFDSMIGDNGFTSLRIGDINVRVDGTNLSAEEIAREIFSKAAREAKTTFGLG